MTYHAKEDYQDYAIPSTNFQIGDVIDFYVRAKVEETDKQFTCFPTQAQFDWTASPAAEERDFFSVLVADSTLDPVPLSEDLRDDPSWSLTSGEWEFGAPTLVNLSEQPGNDYPFDDDFGGGESPKPNCYFTNATDPVEQGDPWTLITESFDLSGLDDDDDNVVVSYALWFYVRKGSSTGQPDKFTVEIGDGTNWLNPPIDTVLATGVDGSATALQRWIRRRVTVGNTGQHATGRKLRFTAHHPEGANGVVEAVIDEVRVWGVKDD